MKSMASTRNGKHCHIIHLKKGDDIRNNMAYSLAFATRDGNSEFPPLTRGLTFREREQLRISTDQLRNTSAASVVSSSSSSSSQQWQIDGLNHHQHHEMIHRQQRQQHTATLPRINEDVISDYHSMTGQQHQHIPLPRTLQEALRPTSHRAIVVTETTKPFRVVDVNRAWENLCGYTYVESKGKSLGSLLKGPETDPLTVTALISQLLRGEEATAIVTNYTKGGRKFLNRLHVGPLYHTDDNDDDRMNTTSAIGEPRKVAYFVGVLTEVTPSSSSKLVSVDAY